MAELVISKLWKAIARLRDRHEWTNSQLAKKTAIRPATIYDLEKGHRDFLSTKDLMKICGAFGVTPNELLKEYFDDEGFVLDENGDRLEINDADFAPAELALAIA